MLFFVLILYYASAYKPGIAVPITDESVIDFNDTPLFLSRDADTPDLCTRKRIEIVWSCIATILAASWVSVHPNLPHPKDSKVKKTLRRVELMLWAIITPELIIFWAMRQWWGARKMEREFLEYKKEQEDRIIEPKPDALRADGQEEAPGDIISLDVAAEQAQAGINVDLDHANSSTATRAKLDGINWTRTHGFFLQMGGFVLLEGKKRRILGWNNLMKHYKAGWIDLSDITEASINDHSKADGFAKGLALLQTCWFLIQCIARFADHHLVLTELELVTAALAVLSLFMYFLWWNKPFNAEVPIIITLSDSQTKSLTDDHQSKSVEKDSKVGDRSLLIILKNTHRIFIHISDRIVDIISDYGHGNTDDPIDNQQTPITNVPAFYSIDTGLGLDFLQMILASFSIAALFGAIHCAGWSAKILFSSHSTSLLWRFSSAIITGSPLVWSLAFLFNYADDKSKYHSFSERVYNILKKVFVYLSAPTIPLYIISRIILLILAFVELRDLPPGALATIQWANFVPFIH